MISIIIPAHNQAPYLSRCVKSIQSQENSDWEMILADDSSSDETGIICDGYAEKDSRIQAIHCRNRDVSLTRNAGLSLARGEYVLFTDGDDTLAPGTLSGLSKIISQYHPDIIRFGFEKFFPDHRELWCPPDREGFYQGKDAESLRLDSICYPQVLDYTKPRMLSACAHLYRREFLTENHLQFTPEQQILNEDYLFVMQTMWKAGTIYITKAPYYQYILHSDSLSTSARPRMYQRKKNLYQVYQQTLPADVPEVSVRLRNFYIDAVYNCFVEVCLTTRHLKDATEKIRPLLADPVLQQALSQNKSRICSKKNKIICFLMSRRMGGCMFVLYQIQAHRKKKR